jgi:5-formyltetrahydrofolate cyclo-ligase
MTAKTTLRTDLRAHRASLTPQAQQHAANRLLIHISACRQFRASKHIAGYIANDGEIDPFPIIEKIWRLNKYCYLPVVPRPDQGHLWFAPFTPETPLTLNRYGIPEPDVKQKYWVRAQLLDLMMLPLVGFDLNGNRIGMGAGFYDRSLAFLNYRQYWKHPHVIGLAHDCQRVDNIKSDNWDIPLEAIATDKHYYAVS